VKVFQKDYGYAVGVIRALESRLLSIPQYERMVDSVTAEEAYLVLNDTDFAMRVNDFPQVHNFEKVLENSLLDTKEHLLKITPNNYVLDIIWKWYDFHNFKVLLKTFLRDEKWESVENLLSPFASIKIEDMKAFILDELELPEFITAKKEVLDNFNKYQSVRFIDFILDKFLYKSLLQWSKKIKEKLLTKFLHQKINISNLQMFLRTTETPEIRNESFIKGSDISQEEMEELFLNFDLEEVISKIFSGDSFLIKEFTENKSYSIFEKISNDALTRFIHESRYIPTGPVPIFGYWWARQNAALIIRGILVGKLSNIDSELIRKRTNRLY